MNCVKFEKEENRIKDFIDLPKKIYSKEENMENPDTMKKILCETHPLNKYFQLDKFLIYQDKEPVARFAITTYPNEKIAYLGFYECIDDDTVAKYLFKEIANYTKANNYTKIVGPVDGSFWNKYRMKINLFNRPYTGEPYNKEYYFKQWKDNGFEIMDHYTSNHFHAIDENYHNPKFEEHYKEFIEKGYEIKKPKKEEIDNVIKELYYLITDLYKDFPIYKNISKEDFIEVFSGLKSIINVDMIRIAYLKNELVGFYISVPNYNNIVYHLNLLNIAQILKIRKHPKEYVMLYMGVKQSHIGLGKAIIESIMMELAKNKLTSIGALAHDGKLTQKYAIEEAIEQYEYVLLSQKIKEE